MGTFAFSSHIRSEDHQAVAAAITTLLAEQGYAPTAAPPEESGRSARRGIWLAAANNGWVSLLDSDLHRMHELAAGLSSHLDGWGLVAHVNDSDSWGYTLLHDGAEVDTFDSMGGDEDESGGVLDLSSAQKLADFQKNMRKMAEVQKTMDAAMPPDIRAIKQQVARGAAAPADVNRYMDWMMKALRQSLDKAGVSLPGFNAGPGERDPEEVSRHAERLVPLLPTGVKTETLVAVMRRQAVFAEEVLGEFFRTLGIHADFAHWGYQCLQQEQSGPAAVGLPVVLHLNFERAGPRPARGRSRKPKGTTKKRPPSPPPDADGEPAVLSFAERLVQAFVDAGDPLTAWLEAARHGAIEHLRAQLAAGDDVNVRSENGMTALMFAASGGQAEAMRLLIAAGADVNAADGDGNTALMWAVMGSGLVQPLLDAGADLHARRADGRTALQVAVGHQRLKTAELLRQAGAQE